MSNCQSEGSLAEKLRSAILTLRIIVLALVSGVVTFAGVVIIMRVTGGLEPEKDAGFLLTYMAIGAAPIALIASRVFPAVFAKNARRQIADGSFGQMQAANAASEMFAELGDAGKFWMVYQMKTILAAALIEGAAFFSLVAYMLEGSPIAMGLAIGLGIAILALFPSPGRAISWIEGQMRLMDEEKLLAG